MQRDRQWVSRAERLTATPSADPSFIDEYCQREYTVIATIVHDVHVLYHIMPFFRGVIFSWIDHVVW